MADTALAAAHAALGAVFGEDGGRRIARHYGDSPAEYRAVREAVGIVDRTDLAVVRMWGRDPARMLHGLITNDLLNAPPERAVYAAMLTPKGRMLADLRALRTARSDEPEVLALFAHEALPNVTEQLRKFVPPMFSRWADVSAELGVIGVYGPRATELLRTVLGEAVPALEEDRVQPANFGDEALLLVGTRLAGGENGCDLVAGSELLPSLWDALLAQGAAFGARPIGHAALETLRIEAGRPRYGLDMTDETIPTEAFEAAGLMPRAISFTKGCYTGQEVVVRIAHRGHVNRHLRGLLLGDAPTPAAKTPLFHPETGKEIGWTTSACASPRLRQTIALGYVRREISPGGSVRVGAADGPSATVATLPFESSAA
jgi:folate-binding protein YgfZ